MRFARYLTIGLALGASLWAGLSLLDSSLFWQLKLIIAACGLALPVVGLIGLANRWAESSIQRNGFMTDAEFTAFDAAWLDEMQVEL